MQFFYSQSGAEAVAALVQTGLALSVVKLFKQGFNISPTMTQADLAAKEADYDGYASQVFTAWNNPYLAPAGGATIRAPYTQFDYVDGVGHVANTIAGFWVEDAGGALIFAVQFDTPYPMAMNGNSTPVDAALNFGS